MSDLDSLQARLHYSFKNASLLEEALTAAGTAVSSRDVDGPASGNKRLALIGGGQGVGPTGLVAREPLSGGTRAEDHSRIDGRGAHWRCLGGLRPQPG
jgi:hypothetical protein